jgi:CRISPR/Cas system-associated exonuclease Cas4 (RecB family)
MAFFKKNPVKYPHNGFQGNGFAERGHAIEAWLVNKLKPLEKLGYKFEYMGKHQRSFYDAELGVSGTPDGVVTLPDGEVVLLEIKSIDPRANKNNLPKKSHVWQVQQNMYLVNKCLGIELKRAVLVYIDASNVYDIKEFSITYDGELVQIMLERAVTLWKATVPDDLEPDGVYSGDCENCPATHHCSKTVEMQNTLAKLADKPSPFLRGETESLNVEQRMAVEQWLDAYDGLKPYGEQKEAVDGEVRQLVVHYNGYVEVDGRGLLSRTQPGRETVDKKLMEADGLDVKKYTKVGAPFVVLNVKGAT